MVSGNYADGDGESSNPSPASANLAAHMVSAAHGHNPFAVGAHQFRNAQQNQSVLDPAVVNAAATIAVATAQAVHQVHNALGAQSNAGSIAASLADSRHPLLGRQAANPSVAHIAAMLANPGMLAAPFGANHASLHQIMNLGGGLSSSHTQGPVPSAAAVAPPPSANVTSHVTSPAPTQNMQSWSVAELEKHVALLQQLNRPVPQYVGLLLTEARRKQKKKHAKRIANRRSASTSRARKKQYVEEMKVTNARLKRQALILSLLPDLVVAISTDGEITFCSAQVERVLKHKTHDLIGAKLSSLLVPDSRDALVSLISEMVSGEKESAPPAGVDLQSKRRRIEKRESGADTDRAKVVVANRNGDGNGSGSGRSSMNTANAPIVSEQSFPLSVVEVDSKQTGTSGMVNTEQNEASDDSTNNSNGKAQMSSLTTSIRSPTVSSGDEKAARGGGSRGSNDGSANAKRAPSSDDSASLSSDAKNMSKANENLSRNVRRHNQMMMEDSKKKARGPKDDVTGASVTANNATARLSSLKHVPNFFQNKDDKGARYESNGEQSSSDDSLLAGVEEKKKAAENASDDSGYRESNDSREETSSSGSDTSNSNGQQQKKPLAATCTMCLIRQDLTTVWCEVTSSVRTRMTDEESIDSPSNPSNTSTDPNDPPPVATAPKEDMLEILLCLRPIRNGEKRADESFRLVPVETTTGERIVSSSSDNAKKMDFVSGSGSGSGSGGSGSKDNDSSGKRTLPMGEEPQSKKQKTAAKGKRSTLDTEQAVESLMCLNKSSQ